MKIKPLQIIAHIILIIGVLLMVLPIWISFASSTHENVSILTEGMRLLWVINFQETIMKF